MQVSLASFGRMDETIQLFHFAINGFHVFGNKFCSKKNKYYIILHVFFFFVELLLIFIYEQPHNTLSVFNEGEFEHILGAKVCLYGFQSIFWQVLIDF